MGMPFRTAKLLLSFFPYSFEFFLSPFWYVPSYLSRIIVTENVLLLLIMIIHDKSTISLTKISSYTVLVLLDYFCFSLTLLSNIYRIKYTEYFNTHFWKWLLQSRRNTHPLILILWKNFLKIASLFFNIFKRIFLSFFLHWLAKIKKMYKSQFLFSFI